MKTFFPTTELLAFNGIISAQTPHRTNTMSRSLVKRLATRPRLTQRAPAASFQLTRPISSTAVRCDQDKTPTQPDTEAPAKRTGHTESLLESIYGKSKITSAESSPAANAMNNLSQSAIFQALNTSRIDTSSISGNSTASESYSAPIVRDDDLEPYHFHVFAHKHNTHVTVTKPNREPIISMSCGNIGFKKSRRKGFDPGYSITKYVIERLTHNGWPLKMRRVELVLRGFGGGRDGAIKVLMSPEGKIIRDKIVRVADSTRIKFGGTRSPKARRL